MKRVPVLLAALAAAIALTGGCAVRTLNRPDVASDSAAVEHTLLALSDALASGNIRQLQELTTDDFLLTEDGALYDRNATIASVQQVTSGGKLTRMAKGFRTQVRQDVAWSQYRVTGDYAGKKGAQPINLLETVILERRNGRWRAAMITSVPATTP